MTDDFRGPADPAPIDRKEWLRLEPLVDHALELPAAERASYIAETRARDPVLAAALERFIADCEVPDPRVDVPAPELFAYLLDHQLPSALPPNTVLADRYLIHHEIGRGGMAIVYLANDVKLNNAQVAVKLMRRGNLTTNAKRFDEEIRLTSKLHHPNIVLAYDKGEFDDSAFFVMPYVEGETLRARLEREPSGRLPIPEALRIGIEVARALDYAHRKKVIHRDVKPSNLLLTSGVAMLADFGIARALASAGEGEGGDPLTDAGVRLGTPAYMSPEQSDAGEEVDNQTDIYSLGCVLYEMIAGEKPTAAATRVREGHRGVDSVRPLRNMRGDVSPRLEASVAAAIGIVKADRTRTAADLARVLELCAREYGVSITPWRRLYWRAPRRVTSALIVSAAAIVIGGSWVVRRAISAPSVGQAAAEVTLAGGAMDTSRVVVLPFAHRGIVTAPIGEDDRLRDALKRWEGVDAVDRLETRDELAHHDTAHLTATVARDIGRALRAARYIRGEITRAGDSSIVRLGLYDTRTGVALANATSGAGRARGDSVFGALAVQLLFPGIAESTVAELRSATRSRPALQAYARSQAAIASWDLARADTALTSAINYDQRFALAYLWLAQVRSWREMSPATWQFAARRASAARVTLGPRDRRVADALTAMAALDSLKACNVWRGLTTTRVGASDFAAWYGVARCEYFDRTVVRDPRSPSGWGFRSSYHHATDAYRRAFQILPAIHREFRSSWYSSLKRTLRTQRTQLRLGVAQRPDTGQFLAYPAWSEAGDTLAFVPYPMRAFEEGRVEVVPATSGQAAEHQRQVFLDIATTWRAAFRPSADALLAVAVALDEAGDSTAVDSVRAARRLADEAGDAPARLRTGAEEVWMLVKRSVPHDPHRLAAARLLADTLIRDAGDRVTDSTQALALASLAALTGRVHRAAWYARGAEDLVRAPAELQATVRALQAYAALGAPPDSISALASALWTAPAKTATISDRARWMRRAATIAFPVYHDSAVRELARSGDFLAVVESAWLDRDTVMIRQRLSTLRTARTVTAPEELKLETLYPEAWLLASMGDAPTALGWITPTLDAQARSSIENLHSVVAVGALVRAMALRAQLASRAGRTAEAATWARAVIALWSDSDRELQGVVREMKRLAK
ncbi:MAG TPA: serine/threonine-protein kinase [Gemmatimonadaceae bacterium]|jgi:hypothetical protein